MQRHGWTLLFHDCLIDQLRKLEAAATRAQRQDSAGSDGNANVTLFKALSQLILEVVPIDPNREEFRQGNTLGGDYRHWRRAKIGRRMTGRPWLLRLKQVGMSRAE
jgi:toxin YhaV